MRFMKLLVGLALVAFLVVLVGPQLMRALNDNGVSVPEVLPQPAATEPQKVEFVRVVDGDTIVVRPTDDLPATNDRGDEHAVRLLSIDTPEMNYSSGEDPECGAQDATDHLTSILGGASTLTLTFDARADRSDRYGRSLAYVGIDGGNTDVALSMLQAGYAEAWYPSGEPEPERFGSYTAAQQDAAAQGAGAHATCESIGR